MTFLMAHRDSEESSELSSLNAPFKFKNYRKKVLSSKGGQVKFLRFSLFHFQRNVRADFFGSAAGGGAAQPCEPRSGELTRFFEIRSNLFKNVHQKRNGGRIGGSAGCALLRRQRCKGIIQIRREPP